MRRGDQSICLTLVIDGAVLTLQRDRVSFESGNRFEFTTRHGDGLVAGTTTNAEWRFAVLADGKRQSWNRLIRNCVLPSAGPGPSWLAMGPVTGET